MKRLNAKIIIIFVSVLLFLSQPAFAIKIGLIDDAKKTDIGTSKGGTIYDFYSKKPLLYLKPMKPYQISFHHNSLIIKIDREKYTLNTNKIILKKKNNGLVYAKNNWYRDNLIVQKGRKKGRITVINDVLLEHYILGVVPSEMPPSWNTEAHKAQAIAARSYAVANLGKRKSRGYDLRDTPHDQAYGGASAETQKTNKAVSATKGQVLVYKNKVIPAYYHSSAGGHTNDGRRPWDKKVNFVRSVPSYDGNRKRNGHGVGMSQYGANVLANHGYNAYQILNYFYKDVRLYKTSSNL